MSMFFKTGISRRWFMKLGLSGYAGLTVHKYGRGKSLLKKDLPDAVSRTSLKNLQAIPTTCRQCPAGCGIVAYLDGDRLVQVMGNPGHPDNRGGLCAKGIAGVNLVNDVERLLHPLKRVGERGGSRWSRITWDEAFNILESRLRPLMSRGQAQRLVVDSGSRDPLLETFLSGLGDPNILWRSEEKNLSEEAALKSLTGLPVLEADIENSRFIFNFGANPFEHHDRFVGIARRLVNARVEKGARLVTFDVRMSKTAAGSDEWIPLKAGTDGLLALAFIRVILDNGLYRDDYFSKSNPSFIPRLKKHVSGYSLDFVASECGVPIKKIEELARMFASHSPAVALMGNGATDHHNGFDNARAITLLNILSGSIGKKGGLYYPGNGADLKPVSGSEQREAIVNLNLNALIDSCASLDTCLITMSNPAYSDSDCLALKETLKDSGKVPFLAVMDTHMTETALLADLVLPAATYLESWNIETRFSLDKKPLININQPAAELMSDARILRSPAFNIGKLLEHQFRPRGESLELGNLCLELSGRLGGRMAEILPFEDTRDYVRKQVAGLEDVSRLGGLEYLKAHGCWEGKQAFSCTDTERFFRRYSPVFKAGQPVEFPEYHVRPTPESEMKNKFTLTTYRSCLDAHGTSNSKWIREFSHENRLWMNSGSARKLGLKNGSRVRVISRTGQLVLRILTTERIHPDSVALSTGLGHTGVGQVARAKAFKSRDRDTELIWWGKKGNGINPQEITAGKYLKDTRVVVEKV
jgi:thiosulfate reductase/polysulfide reductase chain A